MDEWQPVLRGQRDAKVLILAAHPDDETIGAGATLARLRQPVVVHLTDGAPRDRRYVSGRFQGTLEEYAAERRKELLCAMAGLDVELRSLGGKDQEAMHALAGLSRAFAAIVEEVRPHIVITHPYEGGHPDHDACAFVAAQSRDRFTLVEFASYNAFGHEFLVPGPGPRVPGVEEKSRNRAPGTRDAGRGTAAPQSELVITLTASERQNKRTMMACYETQVDVLAYFSAEVERFRIAPAYDFTSPPHDGPLNYEKWEWPMTGEEWRRLAAAALR